MCIATIQVRLLTISQQAGLGGWGWSRYVRRSLQDSLCNQRSPNLTRKSREVIRVPFLTIKSPSLRLEPYEEHEPTKGRRKKKPWLDSRESFQGESERIKNFPDRN